LLGDFVYLVFTRNDGMAEKLTISQLKKIGERLRKNLETEEDLRSLDAFRSSFTSAYQQVFDYLTTSGLNPGGRQSKTTLSIRAKLIRERSRLSRMQDIAGCRVVVDGLKEQDRVLDNLRARWPNARVDDRRLKPSHGYRAVHVITVLDGYPVEIQVRTRLQHSWATASEKLADVVDSAIKYGGGPDALKKGLAAISKAIASTESLEESYSQLKETIDAQEVKKEMLDRVLLEELERRDEKSRTMGKEIRDLGGLKVFTKNQEMKMEEMRRTLNSLLQKVCKMFNVADEV